jgi:hypothetical protein
VQRQNELAAQRVKVVASSLAGQLRSNVEASLITLTRVNSIVAGLGADAGAWRTLADLPELRHPLHGGSRAGQRQRAALLEAI